MLDYYLSTTEEAVMHEVLSVVEVPYALDVIGEWYENEVLVPGWHFNVRSELPIEWPASVVQHTPVTPWRIWG